MSKIWQYKLLVLVVCLFHTCLAKEEDLWDAPRTNSDDVESVTDENFELKVMFNGKDTLIEFYAPWCLICKKLAPVYNKVAEALKNESVAILKMDVVTNQVPAVFEVLGFPTLYWLPRDNKGNPLRYEGGREFKDLIKYIAEHATEELKGYDRQGYPKTKHS